MKRSEMIEILENEINGRLYPEDHFYTDDISHILKVLEIKGMLPPEAEIMHKRDLGGGLEVSFYKKERVWEDEDEKSN